MNQQDNTINDLYRHLFETLKELRTDKITVEKANAISNVSQTIINAGKLECNFINTVGGSGTGFVPGGEALPHRNTLRLVNRWNSRSE